MKKAISLVLALVLCLSLCACGGSETDSASGSENGAQEVKLEITSVGQEVTFGTYYKSSGGDKEDMQWIVLDIQDGQALLICKYAIEPKKNEDVEAIYGYMNLLATKMFTDEEKNLIVNQKIDGEGCYMFLLDSAEVEQYMPGDDNFLRLAQATSYAESEGVDTYTNSKLSDCCNWALRDGNWVGGQLGNYGEIITTTRVKYSYGIRPAMWVTID